MNGSTYAILGYVIGLALLWGYVATLWLANRHDRKDGVS